VLPDGHGVIAAPLLEMAGVGSLTLIATTVAATSFTLTIANRVSRIGSNAAVIARLGCILLFGPTGRTRACQLKTRVMPPMKY